MLFERRSRIFKKYFIGKFCLLKVLLEKSEWDDALL
jgi:hypothetical protein